MRIAGLQRLTLLDFPGHVACTVFTAGCNLRCGYCHNRSLVLPAEIARHTDAAMSEETFFQFLDERRDLLEGVAVTGGEPTLHPDLPRFLRDIRTRGFLTKLDTNGFRPDVLRTLLVENLLDYVAVDIKASPARYAALAGQPVDIGLLAETVALLQHAEIVYELRTTLIRGFHDEREFRDILTFVRGAPRYVLQNFRASSSCLDPAYERETGFTLAELAAWRMSAMEYVGTCEIRA